MARYSFGKIVLGPHWTQYSHPNFIKDRSDLLHLIRKPEKDKDSFVAKGSIKSIRTVKAELEEVKNQFGLLVDYNKNLLTSNRSLLNQMHLYRQNFESTVRKNVFIMSTVAREGGKELLRRLSEYFNSKRITINSKDKEENKEDFSRQIMKTISEQVFFGDEFNCSLANGVLEITYQHLKERGETDFSLEEFKESFEQRIIQNNEIINEEEKPFVIESTKDASTNNNELGIEIEERERAMSVQSVTSKVTDQNMLDFEEMGSINFGDSLLNTPLRPIQPGDEVDNSGLKQFEWGTDNNMGLL